MTKHVIKRGEFDPIPEIGDKLVDLNGFNNLSNYTVGECTCVMGNHNVESGRCGYHIFKDEKDTGNLCWRKGYGWFVSGMLIRKDSGSKNNGDLRSKNTLPDATNCAGCGEKLKNPMPWLPKFKYCPKCEP